YSGCKLADAIVNHFDGAHGRLHHAGMADHVRVGEVDNNQVKFLRFDSANELIQYLISGHFRLQIIGRDLWARHQNAFLAGIDALLPAVQEEGDMGIFFGFRDAKLRPAGFGDNLAERLADIDRREQGWYGFAEIRRIFDHAFHSRESGALFPGKAGKAIINNGDEQLTRAIGAEIRHDERISIRDAAISAGYARGDKFVGFARRIGRLKRGNGVVEGRAFGTENGVIALFDTVPVGIAVHREVAPDERREAGILQ